MKNQIKSLIFSLVALVMLVSFVFVFKYVLPEEVEATATPEAAGISLVSLSEGDIQSISVQSSTEAMSAVMSNGQLTIPALQGYPLDESNLNSLLTSAASLTASREIGQSDLQLADYGLAQSAAQVQIVADDGAQVQFMIGDQAPASLGTYVLMNDTVYLVDSNAVSAFMLSTLDYVSLSITESLAYDSYLETIDIIQGGTETVLSYVPEVAVAVLSDTIDSNGTPDVSSETDTSEESTPAYYNMTKPVSAEISYDDVSIWTGSGNLTGLSASSIAVLNPDAAQINDMGFDAPFSTITYTTTSGDQVTLMAAGCDENSCYVMRDGVNIIYLVNRSSLRWLDISPETLLATLFPGLTPADVQRIVISNGSDRSYTLVVNGDQYTKNSISITQAEFDAVVNTIITIDPYIEDQACDLSLSTALTVELTLQDGTSHLLEMVPTGSSSLYLLVDGNCRFVGSEGAAQTILTAASQANGVEVTEESTSSDG